MLLTTAIALSQKLAALKAAQGSTAKREIAATLNTPDWRVFLDLVGNPNRQWYITWGSVQEAVPHADGIEFDDIWTEAEMRVATPTQTARRVKSLLHLGWPERVLKAIVEKTLDAGITVKEVLKSQGTKLNFGPALCADWCDMNDKKRAKLLSERRYASTPKMDGLRCLYVLIPGKEAVLSRVLKPLKNLNKQLDALLKMFKDCPGVVDGEILSSNSWNDTVTAVKKEGSTLGAQFYPFDYIPADEYLSTNFVMKSEERKKVLDDNLDYGDESLFVQVHRLRVHTIKDVWDEHARCLEEGWEGTVLHDLDAPYACKRSASWVKVKSWKSENFRVTGFGAGTGKHYGRLGEIRVEGDWTNSDTGETQHVVSKVGTGFSDALRKEIWENQSLWLNALVEVKFFETTIPDREGVRSLRFPSYLRRRTDLE